MTAPDALLARILDEGHARTRDEAVLAAEVRSLRAKVARGRLRERIVEELAANGLIGNNEGLHGWRCAYPDRYGDCTCVDELVSDIMRVVTEETR